MEAIRPGSSLFMSYDAGAAEPRDLVGGETCFSENIVGMRALFGKRHGDRSGRAQAIARPAALSPPAAQSSKRRADATAGAIRLSTRPWNPEPTLGDIAQD